MRKLWEKYRSIILYIFFGGVTTVVNIVSYAVCSRWLGMTTVWATVVAWILSVAVAYITNKLWVFESRVWDIRNLMREITSFVTCRLATGVMDLVIMYVSVDILHWNDLLMKVISNVLVIVLNYIFSKLVIFRKQA